MTAYWTCTRCKRVIEFMSFVGVVYDRGEDPDTIDGARVCRACCREAIEASKEKKGDG